MHETRPALTVELTGRELRRWYWLRSELAGFARSLGISAAGGKQQLTARVVDRLDSGAPVPRATPPTPPVAGAPSPRPAAAQALAEPLTAETVLPAGQRCTQQLRRYFLAEIGPSFRFNGAMRDFISNGAGRTLGAAIEHWHVSRAAPRPEISAQFELNRFMREWHRTHPTGSRSAALDAWRRHRSLPVDARP